MVIRVLFFLLLLLALLGDARIFLFVLNRFVFGSHRHEKSPWTFLIWTTPPLLLALTALFWPLHRWMDWLLRRDVIERITPQRLETTMQSVNYARVGLVWLVIAGAIGLYWIVDRFRVTFHPDPLPAGIKPLPGEIVRIRRAHIPFAWLRNLGAHNDVYDVEVTRHEVFIEGLPAQFDGYRIAFLTDTHVARFVRKAFYETIIDRTSAFQPDLILLGGDFVTWNRHIGLMADVLSELHAPDGVLAVLGNHDYWAGGEETRRALEAKGVRFIINTSHRIQRRGAELPIVGIDEVYRGEPDLEAAFAGVSPGPRLGLSHHPDIIDLLDGRRLDLLVCGHTHGGQIRFPFFGPVVVPSMHEGRYASGFHREGDVLMYVSRGIGAIPPVRILCRPEVATFVLRQGSRTR